MKIVYGTLYGSCMEIVWENSVWKLCVEILYGSVVWTFCMEVMCGNHVWKSCMEGNFVWKSCMEISYGNCVWKLEAEAGNHVCDTQGNWNFQRSGEPAGGSRGNR